MDGERPAAAMAEALVQAPSRAQLPDVARITGVPERTLQHWFREYANYRSRRGYPTQLILDVLRDHEWEGDSAGLVRALESGGGNEQAIERHAPAMPEVLRDYEQRLAALAEQCERLATELAALRTQHIQGVTALLNELRQVRIISTQVATLNELRGVREDLLAIRTGQQRAEQSQRSLQEQLAALKAALASRRRWWFRFRRRGI